MVKGTPFLDAEGTTTKSGAHPITIVATYILLSIFAFLGLAEVILAFLRNSHILGFILGLLLLLGSLFLIALYSISLRKTLSPKIWYVMYGIFAACFILMFFVTAFILVKVMSYSQMPSDIVDTKDYRFFTEDCISAAKKCTLTTAQSRAEDSRTFNLGTAEQPIPAFYIQTSHTDAFLGLITDGKYLWFPNPNPSEDIADPQVVCNKIVCTRVTCSKRIAAQDTD